MKTPRLPIILLLLLLVAAVFWTGRTPRNHPEEPALQAVREPVLVPSGKLIRNPSGKAPELPTSVSARADNKPPRASVTMDTLTAENRALSFDARERFLAELNRGTLSANDRETLMRELRHPGPYPGLGANATYALKNQMLNVLLGQPGYRAETTDLLLALHQDRAQDPVMRDYALQHLSVWRARQVPADPTRSAKVEAVFWQAVEGKEGDMAGTALLALYRFGSDETQPENAKFLATNRSRLEKATLHVAQNGSLPARVSATALCGQLQIAAAQPYLEKMAATSPDITLRSAAFHALGQLAANGHPITPSTLAMLEQSAASSDYRLRTAARAALQHIEKANLTL